MYVTSYSEKIVRMFCTMHSAQVTNLTWKLWPRSEYIMCSRVGNFIKQLNVVQ